MNRFYEEIKDVYRLRVPFEDLYTSVFLIKSEYGLILVDSATTDEDVKTHIVTALKKAGYSLSDIDKLVLTHSHRDHAGGLSEILRLAPNIEVVRDVREIFDGIYTVSMPGHTEDSIGVLDTRSGTLISGDGLQGAGVGKYRCSTQNPIKYLDTVDRIKKDERIKNILFSHAYEPWDCDCAIGRHAVDECLFECLKYVKEKKQ